MRSSPILVTGSHRSGTTWTGTLLGLSGEALPIHEPFNPGYSRSWLTDPPNRWFECIDSTSATPWTDQMQRVMALRPPITAMARRRWSPRYQERVARDAIAAVRGRRKGQRPLLKDPIAFFSAGWIHREFDADVVVLVRHPAAFASSLKRMNWGFDFQNLASQERLMAMLPEAHANEVNQAGDADLDILDTAILLWRVINGVAVQYQRDQPEFLVRRYEDLAAEPIPNFKLLYEQLGLTWSAEVERSVLAHTSPNNTSDVADGDKGGVVRDSRAAIWTWLDRLTEDELNRVRDGTADVAHHFYGDADWCPPGD